MPRRGDNHLVQLSPPSIQSITSPPCLDFLGHRSWVLSPFFLSLFSPPCLSRHLPGNALKTTTTTVILDPEASLPPSPSTCHPIISLALRITPFALPQPETLPESIDSQTPALPRRPPLPTASRGIDGTLSNETACSTDNSSCGRRTPGSPLDLVLLLSSPSVDTPLAANAGDATLNLLPPCRITCGVSADDQAPSAAAFRPVRPGDSFL